MKEARLLYQLLLAVTVVLCASVSAQGENLGNVDVLEPVVRVSPVKDEPGEPHDFWGWSAVLHHVNQESEGETLQERAGKTRIIVGAPRGSFPGGLGLPDPGLPHSNLTGLIYSCPVTPGPCQGVRGDTTVYLSDTGLTDNSGAMGSLRQGDIEGRLFDQAPNAEVVSLLTGVPGLYENKTGQLLGATLLSTGEVFVACAPRWTYHSFSRSSPAPRGTCYASGRSLEGFEQLYPCQAIQSQPTNDEGEDYCLASTGIDIVNGDYVIGAPGGYFGSGVLYSRAVNAPPGDSFTREGTRRLERNLTADRNFRSPNLSANQGFKVTSGNIRTADDGSGATEILATVSRFGDNYFGTVYFYDVSARTVLLAISITGTQMGEFFGYSIAAVDLNGDGYDEVIVGAPMYSDIGLSKIEKGRVYVFMNMQGTLDETPLTLERSVALGRFGSSIENLGDIDDDGCEDIAVGAPYTPLDGGNSGAVYIYYGNTNFTAFCRQEPQMVNALQIVTAVSSLEQLQTFGWSLSGRVDVDSNNFDDLVIGAYESQAAVLLRTIPVVNITASIDAVATSVDLDTPTCPCSVSQSMLCPCFMVTVRASYSTAGDTDAFSVNFTLREQNDESRIFFDPDNTISRIFSGTFVFTSASDMPTVTTTVYAGTDPDVSNFDPYVLEVELQPIERIVSVEVTGNQTITSFAQQPKFRQTGDPTQTVLVTNPCGLDGCQSDVVLQVDPTNIRVLIGSNSSLDVLVTYTNVGMEDAVDLVLQYQLPDIFSDISSVGGVLGCVGGECALESRLRPGQTRMVTFRLTVDPNVIVGNEGAISVPVQLLVNSEGGNVDTDTFNNAQNLTIQVAASADISTSLQFSSAVVTYSSDPVGGQAVGSVDELGPRLDLVVTVQNGGPTPIPNARVVVSFPSRSPVTGDFYFLYPAQLTNTNGTVCATNVEVDPENLVTRGGGGGGSRRRRSVWSQGRQQSRRRAMLSRPRRQVTPTIADSLICSSTPEACITIACNISRLATSVTITVESYVDERFFFDKEGTYTFEAYAEATILDGFLLPEDTTNNNQRTSVSVSPPELDSGPNILLVTILPIIGGIIIIVILAVLLYFVGFFQRKKRPEEQEAEGDFDVTQYNVNDGAAATGGKEKEEVTGL